MDFLSNENVRGNDNIRMEPQEYIQSQYSASPALCQLLGDFRDRIRTDVDFTVVCKKMVDIDTASGIALDNLGRIVNISRTLELDDGTFYLLDDELYRLLLKYKMLANITNASQENINALLAILFKDSEEIPMLFTLITEKQDGDQYYNGKPMHIRWIIPANYSDIEVALFKTACDIILGAGVGYEIVSIDVANTFGFLDSELQPFNQGIFWNGEIIKNS